jgi:hypothetical protein
MGLPRFFAVACLTMATPGGRNVIKLRRSKGRKRLAPTTYQK